MGQVVVGERQSPIFPNVCAKIGCCQTVVSKKEGVQTPRSTGRTSLSNDPNSVLSERDIMNALIIGSVRSSYPVEGAAVLGFRARILRSSSGMK